MEYRHPTHRRRSVLRKADSGLNGGDGVCQDQRRHWLCELWRASPPADPPIWCMAMMTPMMNADLTPPPSIAVPAEVAPPTRQCLVAAIDCGHREHEHEPHVERSEATIINARPGAFVFEGTRATITTPTEAAALDHGHHDHKHDPHLERAEEMPPRQLDDSMWLPAPDRAPWMPLSECRGTPLVMLMSTFGGD